jgi:Flp pilus assembly pilin Flp
VTTLTQKIVVRLHDAKLRRDLRRDEEGLTMLAYALGAAVIIVPLAAAVLTLGNSAVTDAGVKLDAALA